MYTNQYNSPIGKIILASDGEFLTGLWFSDQKYFGSIIQNNDETKELSIFDETKNWLDIYFSEKIPNFTPPIRTIGSDFRKNIWEILLTIPYGKTMTYGEISEKIATQRGIKKMSAQAVGGAVAHNNISLIIPCHRVIGSNGNLTGYAGGIEKKKWLLEYERKILTK